MPPSKNPSHIETSQSIRFADRLNSFYTTQVPLAKDICKQTLMEHAKVKEKIVS